MCQGHSVVTLIPLDVQTVHQGMVILGACVSADL